MTLPSYTQLLMEAKDTEPGPGQYPLPSSLGAQVDSTKESGPAAPMLAKNSKAWSKVFLGKQQQSMFLCRDSPGAVYNPKVLPSGGATIFTLINLSTHCISLFNTRKRSCSGRRRRSNNTIGNKSY
jgi:hypothetical protein